MSTIVFKKCEMAARTFSRPRISNSLPMKSTETMRKDPAHPMTQSTPPSNLKRQTSNTSERLSDVRRGSDWDKMQSGRTCNSLTDVRRGSDWHKMGSSQTRDSLGAVTSESSKSGRLVAGRRKSRERAKVRFKSIVRLTMGCSRLIHAYSLRFREDDELTPFIPQLTFRDYDDEADDIGLLFDLTKFKANQQRRIPDETKKILSKPPEERTDRDLYNVQIALRNIKSISEYPVRMQRLIAANGVYYKYGAKRIVVRQGHPATGFYFILSGSVVVMVMDQENKYARPVAYLSKGMTFGELAIINRTTRQSSVIAKETLELLCISRDDFHRIFMDGGVKNINDPDHNEFINSIGFLKGWPVEIMNEHPKKCIFNYFKEGEALAKDSNYSNWIYIVKSGSLNVLKRLKKVSPFEFRRSTSPNKSLEQPEVKTAKQKKEEKARIEMERKFILSEIKIPMRQPTEIFEFESKSLPQIRLIGLTSTTPSFSLTTPGSETSEKYIRNKQTILPTIAESTGMIRCQTQAQVTNSTTVLKQFKTRIKSVPSRASRVSHPVRSSPSPKGKKRKRRTARRGNTSPGGQSSSEDDADGEISKEMMGFKQTIRTITDDIDAGYNLKLPPSPYTPSPTPSPRPLDPNYMTEADLNPQYVHLHTLTKGQVFGISQLLLGAQPSLCVVSNGAECILIDKQFYLHHASTDLKQRLRQELCPYPSDAVLQDSLQHTVDWRAFRQDTVKKTLVDIETKRLSKVQKIPQKV